MQILREKKWKQAIENSWIWRRQAWLKFHCGQNVTWLIRPISSKSQCWSDHRTVNLIKCYNLNRVSPCHLFHIIVYLYSLFVLVQVQNLSFEEKGLDQSRTLNNYFTNHPPTYPPTTYSTLSVREKWVRCPWPLQQERSVNFFGHYWSERLVCAVMELSVHY